MKLKQIIESEKAISELLQQKLPFNTAFDLKMFVLDVDKEVKTFYELRDARIKEYGEDVGEGRYQIKDEEKIKELSQELESVLDKDIDVKIPEINREQLSKAEITVNDLITLNWLIK